MNIYQIKKRIIIKIKDLLYFLGLNRKKDVLLYLGLNKGYGFNTVFRNYKECYGFEADPDLFKALEKRFRKYKNVHLINAAVAKENGELEFNVSNNGGVSSSIGNFHNDWNNDISMIKKIKIPSINLYDFLQKNNIHSVDDYISDIQGYDLEVLKTLKPMLKDKKIKTIISEVAKDKYRNIYYDLPDNNESAFNELLNENYTLVATGEGVLTEGEFNDVPENWWEMDCMWKAKP